MLLATYYYSQITYQNIKNNLYKFKSLRCWFPRVLQFEYLYIIFAFKLLFDAQMKK